MPMKAFNRFNFGKYRGFTALEVATFDPGYISWCERQMGMTFTPRVHRMRVANSTSKPLYI